MNTAFLGAARTVTGSQHLITVNDKTILLDCGLYHGSPRDARERNRTFDFDPKELDAVILSHAYIDHCGNLPNLIRHGYDGPIYCTPVTAHLADLLMRDSAHIQESEAEEGGRVIIPAFAVGRTQEIVYNIHQMFENGDVPRVPVFVDSPLASEASKVFIDHPEYFDDEARSFIRNADSWTALGFNDLIYIESARDSRALNDRQEPLVIISTTGMLETGRVLHHVRFSIEDPRNTILLVSYQAPNTLGRALLNGETNVTIRGKQYERKAEVAYISGLSAHAGQSYLMEYAASLNGQAKQVFLVHGEDKVAETLQEKLRGKGIEKVYYPLMRQTMEVD